MEEKRNSIYLFFKLLEKQTITGKPRPRVTRYATYTPKTKIDDLIKIKAKYQMKKNHYHKFKDNELFHMSVCTYGGHRADIDNVPKLILDLLQGICYSNDRYCKGLYVVPYVDKRMVKEKDKQPYFSKRIVKSSIKTIMVAIEPIEDKFDEYQKIYNTIWDKLPLPHSNDEVKENEDNEGE